MLACVRGILTNGKSYDKSYVVSNSRSHDITNHTTKR